MTRMEPGPVFIGGPSRSGKTLLAMLLDHVTDIAFASKATNMWTFFYQRYGDLNRESNLERCLAAMLRYQHIRILDPDPQRIRQAFRQGPLTYARLFALFHLQYAQQRGRSRWGDHSRDIPVHAGRILAAHPTAKVIAMVRDPRDRYAGLMSCWPIERGKVGVATACWLRATRSCWQSQSLFPDRFKIVHYENLVSQPKQTLGQICKFLDAPLERRFVPVTAVLWQADCPAGLPRITDRYVGHFRELVAAHELAFIQTYARHEMDALGYDVLPTDQVNLRTALDRIAMSRQVAQMVLWSRVRELRTRYATVIGYRPARHKLCR